MSWIHDDVKNELKCTSEKHARFISIDMNAKRIVCDKCYRNCVFYSGADGYETIRFKKQK